jgi:murein L,D-transpeptidase YafK
VWTLLALFLPLAHAEPSILDRVEAAVSSLVTRTLTTTPSCPGSISVLNLPDWVDPEDPRLNSKGLIIVSKSIRRIYRFDRGRLVHIDGSPMCWTAGLGFTPESHKQRQGDGKTPEGWYRTSDKPWSQFYAAIAVHYPNQQDARQGEKTGLISTSQRVRIEQALQADKKPLQQSTLGGEILIHGGGGATDWTLGCVAMDDADIDLLRTTVPTDIKTDVLILP